MEAACLSNKLNRDLQLAKAVATVSVVIVAVIACFCSCRRKAISTGRSALIGGWDEEIAAQAGASVVIYQFQTIKCCTFRAE